MAFTHGKDTAFSLDDSAGTLRNLDAFVNSVDGLPGEGEVAETTTFGAASDAKTFVRGLNSATFSIAGFYDSTATTGPDVVLSGLRTSDSTATFEFGPEGRTAGDVKYSGECFLTTYAISAPVGDVVSFSADFQVTGAITKGTYA